VAVKLEKPLPGARATLCRACKEHILQSAALYPSTCIHTWRDLKRKMRVQKSDVKKMADTINVNKDYIAPDLSDELHRPLEHKPFTDSDPLESNFNGIEFK
ncbi:jg4907, partial [Pararge aegeria aegeria]